MKKYPSFSVEVIPCQKGVNLESALNETLIDDLLNAGLASDEETLINTYRKIWEILQQENARLRVRFNEEFENMKELFIVEEGIVISFSETLVRDGLDDDIIHADKLCFTLDCDDDCFDSFLYTSTGYTIYWAGDSSFGSLLKQNCADIITKDSGSVAALVNFILSECETIEIPAECSFVLNWKKYKENLYRQLL